MSNRLLYLSGTSLLPEGDIDRPVVFLVEPYATESAKLRLKNSGYEVMPKIWNNADRLNAAYEYLEKTYLSLKDKIGLVLNQIHGVDYPVSFWEIPMASWLFYYLHILFDRYSRLNKAIELYGKENLALFACQCDIKTPVSYVDFIARTSVIEQSASGFYGAVAKEMKIPVLEFTSVGGCQGITFIDEGRSSHLISLFYTKVLAKLKDQFLNPIFSKFLQGKDVLMTQYRFNKRERLVFSKKLNASFFPRNQKIKTASEKVDRTKLLSITTTDEFEKVTINLLARLMPRYLLEEFRLYKDEAKKWNGFKIYFSPNSWYLDILFCYIASFGRLQGAKIIGCQHGGGYGQYKKPLCEFIERKFTDFYITWGWKDSHYSGAQLLPLPQPDLSRYLNKHRTKDETALWAGTMMTKQLIQFMKKMPDKLFTYLNCKRDFISHLDKNIRKVLVYRPYAEERGCPSEENAIFKNYPEVKIKHVGNLYELLRKVKLYICDHQSTSFMEAFVANTPTILFWDKELADERETVVPLFGLLREAGILFHDPVRAAEQVNAIWNDVQGWWSHPERQNARLKFIGAFCQTDKKWQEKWIGAFKEILEPEKI